MEKWIQIKAFCLCEAVQVPCHKKTRVELAERIPIVIRALTGFSAVPHCPQANQAVVDDETFGGVLQCATTGCRRVYFWEIPPAAHQPFQFYSPALTAADFRQAIGDFTITAFIPGKHQVSLHLVLCSMDTSL